LNGGIKGGICLDGLGNKKHAALPFSWLRDPVPFVSQIQGEKGENRPESETFRPKGD
jgi:hypothetical protein